MSYCDHGREHLPAALEPSLVEELHSFPARLETEIPVLTPVWPSLGVSWKSSWETGPCFQLYFQAVPGSLRCLCLLQKVHHHPTNSPLVMKRFERLITAFICPSLSISFDQPHFTYGCNRTDDAINHVLHPTLTHLDSGGGELDVADVYWLHVQHHCSSQTGL